MAKIQRALLSVFTSRPDPFAKALAECGVELISTGGTARPARERAHGQGPERAHRFPEMLDGRVKTSTRRCSGCSTSRNTAHEAAVKQHGIARSTWWW